MRGNKHAAFLGELNLVIGLAYPLNGYFPTKGDKVARPNAFKVVSIWLVEVLTCPI